MSKILLCQTCACGVCNGDWSALDFVFDNVGALVEMARRMGRERELGPLTPTWADLPLNEDGVECALCENDTWGPVAEFEALGAMS